MYKVILFIFNTFVVRQPLTITNNVESGLLIALGHNLTFEEMHSKT